MKTSLAALAVLTVLSSPAWAQKISKPVVLELFTSQGCSSCPPADALLAELKATHPEILPLDLHVDYWDDLGWKDPFSSAEATARQWRYARIFGDGQVYTPQLVVDGRSQMVGSDRKAVLNAISAAVTNDAAAPSLALKRQADGIQIDVGAGEGTAQLLLIGFDGQHATHIGRGENGGRMLTEVNIVRSIVDAGNWAGKALRVQAATPKGEQAAVILQAASGSILAAATLP